MSNEKNQENKKHFRATYKIVEAGLYAIGHFNAFTYKLILGAPDPCKTIEISLEKLAQLFEVLKINWEDGNFVQNYLNGQYVQCYMTEQYGETIAIGDPFGNDVVILKDE